MPTLNIHQTQPLLPTSQKVLSPIEGVLILWLSRAPYMIHGTSNCDVSGVVHRSNLFPDAIKC